jgi:endoribonuclease Dicer
MDLDQPTVSSSLGIAANGQDEDDNAADTDNEDEQGTKRWVVNAPRKPRKISEKKRADNAAFDVWIEENQQNLTESLDKFIVDDNDKTFQSLIRDFENKRIITNPRDYQLELFELAKTQNTIGVLDTGEISFHLSLGWFVIVVVVDTSYRFRQDPHRCPAPAMDHPK